ncbi:beta-2-microglobulin-like [Anomaloglossus baeobatrachus]|uniref:beta-2-microglobulin-like n=1 Tax=Anomaloglossus baeobatrachus TaxID=238106 RepID=UPI003F502C5E
MSRVLCVIGALLLCLALALADFKSPTVNIYSQVPVEYGVKNTLICHTSGFHPPRINITLKKNGAPLMDCAESDLSFGQDWTYHKTKHAAFTPEKGDNWECEVKHDDAKPQTYRLEIF